MGIVGAGVCSIGVCNSYIHTSPLLGRASGWVWHFLSFIGGSRDVQKV